MVAALADQSPKATAYWRQAAVMDMGYLVCGRKRYTRMYTN